MQAQPIRHDAGEDEAAEPGAGGAFDQRHTPMSEGDAPS
jgi:hypothetical protein